MLRKIEWIKNCGIFEDFRWDAETPDFARINLIYGNNGAGKTSLARALDGLRFTETGFRLLSVQLEDGGTRRSTVGQDDAFLNRVFVFCEEYVSRSHRFEPGTADIEAVLTLGKRSAEADARLAELGALTGIAKAQQDAPLKEIQKLRVQLDNAHELISTQIVTDCSRAGGRYRSRGSYSVLVVKNAFSGSHDKWALLTDSEIRANKQLVSADNLDLLPTGGFGVTVTEDIQQRASELLAVTPVTIVLDSLRAHPEASTWVQSGQRFHEGLDTCIYCGSRLTEERKSSIEQHFSDEVAHIQRGLQSLIGELHQLEVRVDGTLARIPARGLFFKDLRDTYDNASKDIHDQSVSLKSWLEELSERLKQKHDNVLENVDASVATPPVLDGTSLETLRNSHNDRVNQHAELVEIAAKKLELHHLKAAEKRVDDLVTSIDASQIAADTAKAELNTLLEEIASLENVEGDPTPTAQVLTEEVSRLLGRNELKFEAVDGRYRVTREGVPAEGLSVGERTAVTLVHFLESVARFDPSNGKAIVVIDDPVSSLDSNIFMGVSTYIWTEVVSKEHTEQLILLTHNFELFRQWDVQIEGMHKNNNMRKTHPAEIYELKSHHVTKNGTTRRHPKLVHWPRESGVRKKVRSSYHHAFIAVADEKMKLNDSDTLENRLDAQLLFPNVMRRMLETFLAFKRPEWVGDFTNAMRQSTELLDKSGYTGNSDALRQKLTRYAHAYSHDETPDTGAMLNPDEIASAIAAVFEFMNQIDGAHFRGMCEVTGYTPENLLLKLTPGIES